jgi:transcriptional regulator GlxA family with amidase domain
MNSSPERKRVGILVFENVEVLDFCGPFEVFSVARDGDVNDREIELLFDVRLLAENIHPISTVGGMQVLPVFALSDCPPLDILIVPGGWGARAQLGNPVLLDWIRQRAGEVEVLASVCTGALLLGTAGLLDGRRATTHWQLLDALREVSPSITVVDDEHVVQDGNVYTSAGISAGIDMSLHIVERVSGEIVARTTARQMEYPYPDDNTRRVTIDA